MDSMQPRQICGRPSGTQMRALLDELESQPHLAGGRTRGQDSRRRIDSLWRQISQRLNNLEGCTKSHKQWQKFWADKKSAVKKQVAARQAEGLSISTSVFSDIELRIVGLLEKTESTHDEDDSSKFVIEACNPEDITMSDSECEENTLIEIPIETNYSFQVKEEDNRHAHLKSAINPLSRKLASTNYRSLQHRQQTTFNRAKLMKRIMKLEKKRTESEERISETLASIASSMKRQEEATQRLTRVLLQLVPRENIQFQPRIQCSRPSVEQVRALLDELEANPYLARGKLRRRSTPIWNSITSRLNVLEGCTKTAKQWMKYWSDKKVGVKRMLEAARVSSESNLQLDIQSTFSDEENRVIAILESSAFVDVQTDYNLQESPSMKEEYLENEDYLLDGTEPSFFDDFEESQAESTTTKVNLEKIIMKKSLRSNSVQKPKQNQMKCRSRPPWCPPSWRALLRMEERRIAAQESTAASLADIEACMRRQEEATRELARVLTRLLH